MHSFLPESFRWFSSVGGQTVGQRIAQAGEYLRGARAAEEWLREKHASGNKGRCGTACGRPFPQGCNSLQRRAGHRPAAYAYCRAARTVVPEALGVIWAAAQAGCLRLHPEKESPDSPAQTVRSAEKWRR